MMNILSYRILFGAGLAMLVGTLCAQTGGNTAYPSPDKAVQSAPTQSPEQTAKTSGQSNAQAQASDEADTPMHGQKAAKHAHHAAKRAARPAQMAAGGETTYRQALRQCVKEQDQDQRDSCLDNAIEQFQRNG